MVELVRIGALRPTTDVPIQLAMPSPAGNANVEIVDPEGVPLLRLQVDGTPVARLEQEPRWLGTLSPRPFERLFVPPAATEAGDAHPILIDRPITAADVRVWGDRSLMLLVLAGPSTDPGLQTLATLRSAAHLADSRANTMVVALPLASTQAEADPVLLAEVVAAYTDRQPARLPELPGETRPHRGTVLLLTGLSGSGKSTIARAVRNAILERSDDSVSLLDGDLVRRHLSAGLGFSPADRETNIRRIGWVAAEIAHHGGLAICSPIAPYASIRSEVRRMAEARGCRFVLVHVSTPLEECERRDRKGLYAKARRGEIRDFTGVDAPYEVPLDADLRLDTTALDVDVARDQVLDLLDSRRSLL
ncbi:adenylyl-sulfate kinase [Flexivirga sp.]|uniref:adenylyl-sulfate kinase n=1 Tax=Flexivirga sp. TaxID=1962927 RepID=UPI003F801FA9